MSYRLEYAKVRPRPFRAPRSQSRARSFEMTLTDLLSLLPPTPLAAFRGPPNAHYTYARPSALNDRPSRDDVADSTSSPLPHLPPASARFRTTSCASKQLGTSKCRGPRPCTKTLSEQRRTSAVEGRIELTDLPPPPSLRSPQSALRRARRAQLLTCS